MFALYPLWALSGMTAGLAIFLGCLILGYQTTARSPTIPEEINFVPAAPKVKKLDSWEVMPAIIAHDNKGLKATLQVLVISADYSWQLGSVSDVERKGMTSSLSDHLRHPGILRQLESAEKIILVGAASSENADRNPLQEEARSETRAENLQLLVKENVVANNQIYTLNLGYYVKETSKQNKNTLTSEDQRKVVIIAVFDAEDGLDLEQALKNALAETPTFPFEISDYSHWSLKRFR